MNGMATEAARVPTTKSAHVATANMATTKATHVATATTHVATPRMTSPTATSAAMSVARLQCRETHQAPPNNHTHRQPTRLSHDHSPDTGDFNEERDADILLPMSSIQHSTISRTLPTCKLRMVSSNAQANAAAGCSRCDRIEWPPSLNEVRRPSAC